MTQTTVRTYAARAASTETFGRVLVSAREQHLIIDGPKPNGCPGEAITPPEAFLGAVASCGVELVQVIARDTNVPVQSVKIEIDGEVDRGNQPRKDVTLFNSVRINFLLKGVSEKDGRTLVEAFKGR
ncbi:MAG TPA: OsmC family protein [Candidatus Koribacter sp.]